MELMTIVDRFKYKAKLFEVLHIMCSKEDDRHITESEYIRRYNEKRKLNGQQKLETCMICGDIRQVICMCLLNQNEFDLLLEIHQQDVLNAELIRERGTPVTRLSQDTFTLLNDFDDTKLVEAKAYLNVVESNEFREFYTKHVF